MGSQRRFQAGLAVLAIVAAGLMAACSGDDPSSLGRSGRGSGASGAAEKGQGTADPAKPAGGAPANAETNSPDGKRFFAEKVQPALALTCGGCHDSGPAPAWIAKADAAKSYAMMFQLGYVATTSRILLKGVHSGGAAPALSAEQSQSFNTWVGMELKDGGAKAPPSVLEKLAGCIDEPKFLAIGLADLRTTRRQSGNNPNNYNENPDTCTGCNEVACSTCHSSDPGSGFVMALGNDVLAPGYTFAETKKTTPAYLQKYFGVSPTGHPIASNAIKLKAEATLQDKAYSHPMLLLSPEMEAATKAFVDDAIAKFEAGQCGK